MISIAPTAVHRSDTVGKCRRLANQADARRSAYQALLCRSAQRTNTVSLESRVKEELILRFRQNAAVYAVETCTSTFRRFVWVFRIPLYPLPSTGHLLCTSTYEHVRVRTSTQQSNRGAEGWYRWVQVRALHTSNAYAM